MSCAKRASCANRASVASLIAILASLMVVGGCAGEETFPDEVPMRGQTWVDEPLEQRLRDELSKAQSTVAGFSNDHYARACRDDADTAARRVHKEARDRVEFAISQASIKTEYSALSDKIELTPIVPYEKSPQASRDHSEGLLSWRCDASLDAQCAEAAGSKVVRWIYATYFYPSGVSREATAQMLPVLRRELEWGFEQIGRAASRKHALATIGAQCQAGKSPLGNYVAEQSRSRDDRRASLARRLGGAKPCPNLTGMWTGVLRMLDNFAKHFPSGRRCQASPVSQWTL